MLQEAREDPLLESRLRLLLAILGRQEHADQIRGHLGTFCSVSRLGNRRRLPHTQRVCSQEHPLGEVAQAIVDPPKTLDDDAHQCILSGFTVRKVYPSTPANFSPCSTPACHNRQSLSEPVKRVTSSPSAPVHDTLPFLVSQSDVETSRLIVSPDRWIDLQIILQSLQVLLEVTHSSEPSSIERAQVC